MENGSIAESWGFSHRSDSPCLNSIFLSKRSLVQSAIVHKDLCVVILNDPEFSPNANIPVPKCTVSIMFASVRAFYYYTGYRVFILFERMVEVPSRTESEVAWLSLGP